MDVIIGFSVMVVVLALWLAARLIDSAVARWVLKGEFPFMTKLVISFLVGFIAFVGLTDRVSLFRQKVAIMIVTVLLMKGHIGRI